MSPWWRLLPTRSPVRHSSSSSLHQHTLELTTIFRDIFMPPYLTSLNWLSASLQSASVQRASRQQLGWPGWIQDTPTPSIASAVS